MLCYNARDLARSFRTVRTNTIKIAEEIPEDQYSFRPAEGVRSVAETLAHIAISTQWQPEFHRLRVTSVDFSKFAEGMQKQMDAEKALATKPQILAALRTNGDEFTSFLESFTDEMLAEQIHFPSQVQPSVKTRFEMLLGTKEHEMHHRGQLMLIERLIGIVPHLTREYQERWEQMQKQMQAQKAGA